jgi:hypothetical protein
LAQLQADLNSIDFLDAIEKGLLGERIHGLEYFRWARSKRLIDGYSATVTMPTAKERILGNIWSATLAEADELSYLKAQQRHLEHTRLVRGGKTWPEVSALMADDIKQIEELAASYKGYLHPVTLIAFPDFRRACQRAIEVETQRQMILAVAALKRYQLRHGAFPADLAALMPEFLPKLPHDWMDQKPLKYRVTENGFALYSVGEDGHDDGGDPAPKQPLNKKDYEMWDGRDAVWPTAVLPGK